MATQCPTNKIDSNLTGLRIAEEVCLGVLPSVAAGDPLDPIWYPQEPNSYSDLGGNVTTVARNPINPTRQRRFGVVTDLDASGGYNSDLTQNNLTRLMQGILYADARQKPTTAPLNAAAIAITGVTATSYTAAAGLDVFDAGTIIFASGFGNTANNGLKVLATDGDPTELDAPGLAVEALPPAAAKIVSVGHQFAAGDASVVISGNLVRLTSAAVDMTSLGLIPGEWIFVGGDAAGNQLTGNVGFARIGRVAATFLELDKVGWVPSATDGAGKSLRIFFGTVIQTEGNPDLIKRRSYQLERTLGRNAANEQLAEYIIGAVPNEFTLNVAQADKVTFDLTFVGTDTESAKNGVLKSGLRPAPSQDDDAFNTSSDFSRIKMSVVDETASNPVALFAFVTDLTLTVNNNVTPVKAVGKLGAIDVSSGTIEVGGSQTAYFSGTEAVDAVRNNERITLDFILCKKNAGLLFDVPLLSLGNGRLNVEQDAPITLPLDNTAAQSKFGTSLMYISFAYLPTVAES